MIKAKNLKSKVGIHLLNLTEIEIDLFKSYKNEKNLED